MDARCGLLDKPSQSPPAAAPAPPRGGAKLECSAAYESSISVEEQFFPAPPLGGAVSRRLTERASKGLLRAFQPTGQT